MLIVTVLIVFQILGVISSVHAVLSTRTSQGAIAWVISLNTLPVVAVPAYWVLGRSKFQGYVNAWQDQSLDLDAQLKEISPAFLPFEVKSAGLFPEYQALKNLAHVPFLNGNQVELLVDGEATYASIQKGIEEARDYILFQFYILRADDIGDRFKQQLIRKANEGVAVYLMFDGLGSSALKKDWLDEFHQAGVKVAAFNTRKGSGNRFQINFRNHRKNVVIDGKSAWVGGLNVGDDYLGEDPKLSPWRDTHLRIDGPSALMAQMLFLSDWHFADDTIIEGLAWQPQAAVSEAADKGMDVLVLGSGPADELETASLFFTNALNIARQRIWIATPYFIPDDATMVALRLALLKQLDVRIITPALNDNWFVRHASNVYLSELSQLGAKIYFYDKGFMHQKVMLLDTDVSMIGTVNFDNRSFRLNFEVTGVVTNREFATEVEAMLLADIVNSTELEDYDLGRESFWERLKAHGSALMAPVL